MGTHHVRTYIQHKHAQARLVPLDILRVVVMLGVVPYHAAAACSTVAPY
jgi:peptidoglycan/LPS O-acetylase OafA/YrhL